MEFSTLFKLILGLFYLTGMVPKSVHRDKSLSNGSDHHKNLTLTCWSLLSLTALCILIAIVFTSEGVFGQHNYIGEFNDMIKVATIYATHLIILVEAFLSRHELSEFMHKISEVDAKLLYQLNLAQTRPDPHRSFVKKFSGNFITIILAEIVIIASVQDDPLWTNLWYLSIISLTIGRLRHLHLMLHVDTITFRLKIIRKELQQIVVSKDRASFHKLCVMKGSYNTLYECCSHINFSFGFSQLCNFMQNFIQLTCDLYWIYSVLYRNDLAYIFVLILALVPTLQVVIVALSSCEQCLKEVREIGFLLHNVDKKDTDMDTLVENFSLQIIHEPFNISVAGFFNMDFTLLKAVGVIASLCKVYISIFCVFSDGGSHYNIHGHLYTVYAQGGSHQEFCEWHFN